MKSKQLLLPAILLISGISLQNSQSATLITGVTVSNKSRENTASASLAVDSINGSGLNTTTGAHDTGVGNEWLAGNGTNSGDFIEYDLGSSYTLDSIHIWNANSNTGRGIKDVDIYVSNVASPGDPEGAALEEANWTRLGGATVTLPQSPALNTYTGFDLESATSTTLPTTPIRYVRFELNSTWGNAYGGISEIQFSQVPEPSAVMLCGLGVLALLRRRRH